MTFISPNDDIESREIIDSIVPETIHQSPHFKPQLLRPRKTPLKQQGGWGKTEKKERDPPQKLHVWQPNQQEQEEPDNEPQPDNLEDEISHIIDLCEEEEEEESYEKSRTQRIPYYFDSYNAESHEESGKTIYQYSKRIVYNTEFCHSAIDSYSSESSEVEGIDYPDKEGGFDDDDNDDDDLDNY